MQRDDVLKILAEHGDELRQQFGVKSLALFGSVARGEARERSDVDLLIEFERPVGLFHFFTVQHYLEDLLGVAQVDLVMPDALMVISEATRHIPTYVTTAYPQIPWRLMQDMRNVVGLGLVASLTWPGGTITGVSFQDPELMGKRLELPKEAVPGVTYVAYLWHADISSASTRWLQETETAARALSMQLPPVEVRAPYPFNQAFATMAEAHADALITMPSAVFWDRRTQLVDLALQIRLPGIFPDRELVEAGGLMSHGPSSPANFRRVATYVDKLLQGAKPADLPVEQATKFELVINLKTAKALGLAIPPTLLFQANEVIQ
jgi:predicted nucleotidyltransferase